MEFVSGLALVLLTLVGYSSGAALGARRRTPAPGVLDLLVIVILWAGALLTRPVLGRWPALAVWIAAGLIVGALLAYVRRKQYAKAPTGEPAPAGESILRQAWRSWKSFAARMGNYQSRVMMALLYFTVVLPFGLGVSAFSDPLRIKRPGAASTFHAKHLSARPSLEEAGRQF